MPEHRRVRGTIRRVPISNGEAICSGEAICNGEELPRRPSKRARSLSRRLVGGLNYDPVCYRPRFAVTDCARPRMPLLSKARPNRRPTILDVAKVSRTSVGTVSRVLDKTSSVRPAVEKRVRDAVERLAYKPNAIAQSMRMKATHAIG